ncbi:hypothetical protein ACRRTK_011320 [Alexandromys fortis]
MVKLFIGNLPREATEQEIRSLFEQYGKVLECDIIKNYGFVHIEDKTAAEDAIRNLHHYKLHGVNINVEASKNKSKASTKLHVGNISPTCTNQELRAKFEEYGPVIECDIVKDYAFVHMERAEDAVEAIRGLDNTEFQEQTMSHLPQVQSSAVPSHLNSTSVDPYDRHLLQNSGSAATSAAMAAAAPSSYYGRDRSPLRRNAAVLPAVGEGYGYGPESEMSQASAATRNSLYDMARYEREQYVDRARYSAF